MFTKDFIPDSLCELVVFVGVYHPERFLVIFFYKREDDLKGKKQKQKTVDRCVSWANEFPETAHAANTHFSMARGFAACKVAGSRPNGASDQTAAGKMFPVLRGLLVSNCLYILGQCSLFSRFCYFIHWDKIFVHNES